MVTGGAVVGSSVVGTSLLSAVVASGGSVLGGSVVVVVSFVGGRVVVSVSESTGRLGGEVMTLFGSSSGDKVYTTSYPSWAIIFFTKSTRACAILADAGSCVGSKAVVSSFTSGPIQLDPFKKVSSAHDSSKCCPVPFQVALAERSKTLS